MEQQSKAGQWQERAAKLFVFLALIGVSYLVLSKVTQVLLPFLLALLLALAIRPGATFLERKCKLPRRAASILLLVLLLILLVALIGAGFDRLASELQRLSEHLGANGELWGRRISEAMDVITRLTSHLPFLSHLKGQESLSQLWTWLDARIAELLSEGVARLSAKIPDALASMVRSVPSVAIFAVTFLLAAFYLCADADKITRGVLSWLPRGAQRRYPQVRERLSRVGVRYLRAYFLLFLMTFAELFLGFTILRLPYTFLPALVISLLDILPVLGVAAVLVPWGAVEILRGNGGLGTGLLILCAVITVLRQILEPRIVGESLGLHPLATLLAAYVGLQLFGLFGMLIGPAVALLIKSLLEQREARTT